MRTTRVVSITLPPALFEEAQALAKEESRTMSELVREALRRYQRERVWRQLRGFGAKPTEMAAVQTEEDAVNLVRQVRKEMAEEAAQQEMSPANHA